MKVTIVALSRFETPSGICRYAFNLAQILSALNGVKVYFVIGKWQYEYYTKAFGLDKLDIEIITIDIPNTSINRNLWFLFKLGRLKRTLNFTSLFLSYPIPYFSILLKNTQIITSVHDFYAFELPENYRFPFFNRLFTKISLKNATIISSLSNVTTKKAEKYFPNLAYKVKTIYTPFNYISLEKYINMSVEFTYFLSVAQHRKNKNLDILVKAFVLYKEKTKAPTKLILIGSKGPETDLLMQLVNDANLMEDVIFLYNVTDEELIKYYVNCKAFLLMSSTEGLGIPLIESLYYSKCIICSDIEVFREIDEENCNLVSLDDDSIENIATLLTDSPKQNTKREIKDKRFSKETIIDTYKEIINHE